MCTLSPNKSDYNRAIFICNEWLDSYELAHKCGGKHLIDTLNNIVNKVPAFAITNTRPFGEILSSINGEFLYIVMKVLMAHVNNPNFTLKYGIYKGKTLLQGVICTGNINLIQLILSNTHGSKTHMIKEPVIIDHYSWEWLKRETLIRVAIC